MMQGGALRERVKIQGKNLVDNGKGGRSRPVGGPEWLDVAEVGAKVVPLRGNEALEHAILRATQVYRVTIRMRSDVTAAHRIFWRGQSMNIRAVQGTLDRRWLDLVCEAGVPT